MPVRTEQVGNFARVFTGMPTKSSDRKEVGQVGNVLTVRSLTGTGIDLSQLERHSISARNVDQYRIETGDILLSARSTSLKTAIVPQELDGCVINATLIGIRCFSDVQPRLLAAWLNGPEGQAALQAVSHSGTLQQNITVAGLSKIVVPLPSLETQRQFVNLLEAADEARQAAIEAAETRYRIATHIAFGNLQHGAHPRGHK